MFPRFSSDVQVKDTANANIGRSRDDGEDVRSVLEGSEELVGVDGHLDLSSRVSRETSNSRDRVLFDRGSSSVERGIKETSVGIVSGSVLSLQISGRDVVSQS